MADNQKEQITEEMNVHDSWYKEAHDQTADSLADFLTHLMRGRKENERTR